MKFLSPKDIDRDRLLSLLGCGKGFAHIGAQFGCSEKTVAKAALFHGFVRIQCIRTISEPLLRELYIEKRVPQMKIAEWFGLSRKEVKQLMQTYGIPLRSPSEAQPPKPDAGYTAVHKRVRRVRGTPKHCEMCGTVNQNLVYDWANVTGDYHNVDDYVRLCRPCHYAFDKIVPSTGFAPYQGAQMRLFGTESGLWSKSGQRQCRG